MVSGSESDPILIHGSIVESEFEVMSGGGASVMPHRIYTFCGHLSHVILLVV